MSGTPWIRVNPARDSNNGELPRSETGDLEVGIRRGSGFSRELLHLGQKLVAEAAPTRGCDARRRRLRRADVRLTPCSGVVSGRRRPPVDVKPMAGAATPSRPAARRRWPPGLLAQAHKGIQTPMAHLPATTDKARGKTT